MSGENDNGGYKKNNVIPINETGKSRPEENSMEDLLRHMRTLRDSVPVNHRLRQELKARLLEGQRGTSNLFQHPVKKACWWNRARLLWVAGGFLIISVALVALLILSVSGTKNLEAVNVAELGRFWTEDTPLAPSVSPSNGFIIVERGGALLLLGRHGSQFAVVSPPPGTKYSSPSWSPDGSKLSIVRNKGTESEILILKIPGGVVKPDHLQLAVEEGLEQAQVVAAVRSGSSPPGALSWSPDGNNLAYSLLEGDQSRIYLTVGGQAAELSPGKNQAWSPDGNWLVVERGGQDKTLWLLDTKGGKSYPLGSGKLPVWNKNGYLMFVRINIRENILSYLPDGSPQFTVQRKTGEIRWVFLGKGSEIENNISQGDGLLARSKLLNTPDSPTGPEELHWLKTLELGGVRSPRTLFLDRSDEYEGLASGEGNSLLLSRRYGDTVALIRMELRENTLKREGGSI